MKVVLVELSHETGKIAVFKMFRKNCLGEFLALEYGQRAMIVRSSPAIGDAVTSRTTKLSPSSPHRTISAYDGSSSILAR